MPKLHTVEDELREEGGENLAVFTWEIGGWSPNLNCLYVCNKKPGIDFSFMSNFTCMADKNTFLPS